MPAGGSYVLCGVIAALWSIALFPRIQGKPLQVKPGCRYEGRGYQEGAIVATSEPCLQCRCVKASLRCRLRVCPRIPDPPPPECHLRVSSEHVCCLEMICGESQCCIFEGVRYGSGSAMVATRRCEYCYCILGIRRCIRPKCLLPLPGCAPLYAPHSCCPVAYNCTHNYNQDSQTSTTTQSVSLNGCRVGNRVYNEGEMVRDIAWKAPCDNCFCAMGAVRCVPLACAPPLQGCSPIVREGQCCPSTYNCSGSIEVKAAQNYASYAFVSKDYANFRKETHFYPVENQMNAILSNAIVEGRGHRIVDGITYTSDHEIIDITTLRSVKPDNSPSSTTTVESDSTSTLEAETMGNEILTDTTVETIKTTALQTSTSVFTTPWTTEVTFNPEVSTTIRESTTTEMTTEESLAASTTSSSMIEETTDFEVTSTTSTMIQDDLPEERFDGSGNGDEPRITERTIRSTTVLFNSSTTTNEPISEDSLVEKLIITTRESSTIPTTILMPDDIFVMNVTLRKNVSVGHVEGMTINPVRSISPDVEAILNITQREKGDDYDYYSEPTLPPSLPNVRIIPFVAADALVKNEKDTTSGVTAYPSGSAGVIPEMQRPTDGSDFYDIVTRENRFSPPVETEGGFVPRDPPYFEASSYHSTDLSLEIGTGVTVVPADITNPNGKEEGLMSDCHFESGQYRHGAFIPNRGLCVICMCYYGEVVCSDEKCPPLKIGCRRVNDDNACCGKIVCVDTAESPTMVLDRADATAPSQRLPVTSVDGIMTPDPFRDVIKTEPAPDLPSLIEDMMPYLMERRISTPRPTTPMSNGIKSSTAPEHPADIEAEFVGELPLMHSSLYNYHNQIDRRADQVVVVTGTPMSATRKENHNFHPGFPSFSQQESSKDSEYKQDFPYDRKTPEAEVQNSSTTHNFASDHNDFRASANASGYIEQEESGSETRNTSTESPSLHPAVVEKTETELPHEEAAGEHQDSFYSFDSVLDLFFAEPTTEKPDIKIPVNECDLSTSRSSISTSTLAEITTFTPPSRTSTEYSSLLKTPKSTSSSYSTGKPIASTATKPALQMKLHNEVSTAVGSLLKLAGCNIYGRMYRVGRLITELSGPCLECRCTEIGVQCMKLSC